MDHQWDSFNTQNITLVSQFVHSSRTTTVEVLEKILGNSALDTIANPPSYADDNDCNKPNSTNKSVVLTCMVNDRLWVEQQSGADDGTPQ